MTADIYSDNSSFIVRIKPNNELVLPSIEAIYKENDKIKTIKSRVDLKNGIDLVIPNKIENYNITELSIRVDESYFNGATQFIIDGVSMWAAHLKFNLFSEKGSFNQTVNYKLEHIGWHGRHAHIHCDLQYNFHVHRIKQTSNVTTNGVTILEFVKVDPCNKIRNYFYILLIMIVLLNIYATLKLYSSNCYKKLKKIIWFLFVWFVPILGTTIFLISVVFKSRKI